MARAWADNEQGNINIDFLVGVVVFLGAFLYLINAIPGIFIPYQTNAVDLSSVAYRTSSILAEDPGWWQKDDATYFTDWEELANRNYATRLGLCVNKRIPNVLSYSKVLALQDTANINYTKSRNLIGLTGTLSYNYSLIINQTLAQGSQEEILNISNKMTSDRIESLDRMVLIRYGEGLFIDCSKTVEPVVNGSACLLHVYQLPNFGDKNISVRIINFEGNPLETGLSVSYYVGPNHIDDQLIEASYYTTGEANTSHQYYIYKTNDNERRRYVEDPDIEEYHTSDIIDIDIIGTKLNNTATNMYGMNVSGIAIVSHPQNTFFPKEWQQYSYQNPDYRYFDYPGIMKLRVWEA